MKRAPHRRTARAVSLLAASIALLPPAATAQRPAPSESEFEFAEVVHDDQNRIGLPRPKGWEYRDLESEPTKDDAMEGFSIFRCEVRTDDLGDITIEILLLNGCAPDERLQAMHERRGKLAAGHARDDRYELRFEPVAHGVFDDPKDDDLSWLMVSRGCNGRGVSLLFSVPTELLEKARPLILEVARRTTIDLPRWPERPTGYEFDENNGIALAFGDRIDERDRREMRKFVDDVVDHFEKQHDEHGFSEELPLEIYFDRTPRARAKALLDVQAAQYANHLPAARRVASVVAKTDEERALLARSIFYCLWFSRYPALGLNWLETGEAHLAYMHGKCGRSLPSVPESAIDRVRHLRVDLGQMTRAPDETTFGDAATWTAFFRLGSSKHRKAYRKLLEELRTESADADATLAEFVAVQSERISDDEVRKTLERKLKVSR